MSDEVIFYTNPQSRGCITRWMLEEVAVPYRAEILQYGGSMKSPEYLAINPMGKVPAIVHGGQVVTEGAAICAYLADTFPEAGLAPRAEERASYYRWMFFAAGPMEQAITNCKTLGVEPDEDKQKTLGYGSYGAMLDNLCHWFNSNTYAAGERFTAADVYLGAHVAWGMSFGTLEKRPELVDYAARATDRAAFRRAAELDEALVKNV